KGNTRLDRADFRYDEDGYTVRLAWTGVSIERKLPALSVLGFRFELRGRSEILRELKARLEPVRTEVRTIRLLGIKDADGQTEGDRVDVDVSTVLPRGAPTPPLRGLVQTGLTPPPAITPEWDGIMLRRGYFDLDGTFFVEGLSDSVKQRKDFEK